MKLEIRKSQDLANDLTLAKKTKCLSPTYKWSAQSSATYWCKGIKKYVEYCSTSSIEDYDEKSMCLNLLSKDWYFNHLDAVIRLLFLLLFIFIFSQQYYFIPRQNKCLIFIFTAILWKHSSFPYKAYKIIHHPITSWKICYLLQF